MERGYRRAEILLPQRAQRTQRIEPLIDTDNVGRRVPPVSEIRKEFQTANPHILKIIPGLVPRLLDKWGECPREPFLATIRNRMDFFGRGMFGGGIPSPQAILTSMRHRLASVLANRAVRRTTGRVF